MTAIEEMQSGLSEAEGTEDPLERARILNEKVLPAMAALRQGVIKQRALSVKEACDFGDGGGGLTYSQVASELGVSKPLIQQMVALAREIHTLRLAAKSNGSGR
ncbi:MAG: hypothetical protein CME24_01160 [Gemmatimonadetes bacterium]|nr:hypothetical protein [Gemmatimonadota bacterium]